MAAMNPNPISTSLSNCCIDERWISGTYIVSGVFTIPFDRIGTTVLQDNLPALFSTLRGKQLRKWPRGISGYYAIPIYVGNGFSLDVVQWVQSRPKYRYAMWHEPVLYDLAGNQAFMNTKWGLYGLAFRKHLAERTFHSLANIAQNANHSSFPTVNGQHIEFPT
jgi:hypothetical protein